MGLKQGPGVTPHRVQLLAGRTWQQALIGVEVGRRGREEGRLPVTRRIDIDV